MSVKEFTKVLSEEMEILTAAEDIETMEGSRNVSVIMLQLMEKLKSFMSKYHFESKAEEIHFFKHIRPKFLTRLLYAQKVFELFSRLPVGLKEERNAYFLRELAAIQKYIDMNRDFLIYYRSNSEVLDEIYFVRRPPDLWMSLTAEVHVDQSCSTLYDQKISKLSAYEKVSALILQCIQKEISQSFAESSSVTWTGPKAALIELLYAIQTNGSCNNGAIDVKDLVSHFENIFNVKLGNFYRTFQEIRIRKMSRTTFLDQLKTNLIKRMDSSDEHPRS